VPAYTAASPPPNLVPPQGASVDLDPGRSASYVFRFSLAADQPPSFKPQQFEIDVRLAHPDTQTYREDYAAPNARLPLTAAAN
jgi:hypothetical protein